MKEIVKTPGRIQFAALMFSSLAFGFAAVETAYAQNKTNSGSKKILQAEAPLPASGQPATVEEASRVLDLRTIPLMEGAKVSSMRTLGMLMYEAKGTPTAAMQFQRQLLQKAGFKELPGGYSDPQNCSARFSKDGFQVAVSASEMIGEPEKAGWAQVSLVNGGNVAMEKLPVPRNVKPFYPQAFRAAYLTEAPVAETAAECRKLLIAAGWEPYGQASNDPSSVMHYFKRNAIKLQSWVSTAPAEGNKTLIRYDTELLSADLPAPPSVEDPQYTDMQKTLRFDAPKDQTDSIIAFYQERLAKQGWKPTTERPVTDDRERSQFIIYRNPQKELLSLDLKQFKDIVRVSLKHQTAAELEEEERQLKKHQEQKKAELAKQNMKVKVAVPLPAQAKNIEKQSDGLFEFTLPGGSGSAALNLLRKHFAKEGWTEEEGAEAKENHGNVDFKKDKLSLNISYIDIGIGNAEIRVSAQAPVVLEPTASKESVVAEPKAKKKATKRPAVPGLPELPPGVELPDDVKALLNKALDDAGNLPKKPKK